MVEAFGGQDAGFFHLVCDITMILFFLHQNIEDVICSACVCVSERERETERD